MSSMDVALLCRALGDSNRLQIIQMLSGGEKCACKLLERFEITQPTLSHHMKILCECGLVEVRREGRWSHYSLNGETLGELKHFFEGLSCEQGEEGDGCLCSGI
ncbi:ArsR/SmtB family transcription factor [Candidatus Pseudoscillospira sp. SGI.172]|uniref:ArsR/SmtB family transcription factor n=1 Tax=Candidatus Pseudoscillospira sp. SGI.172 TaxID=3420582 RepID=UPI0009BA9893|nr:metalloregulator ArsR/SmtB family transcription factor [Pseudoflavonifractor sp.]MDY3019710.1 metalloregulator ArsR/SmtB family transcription factor [Oscillospiraceae bacterium]